MNILPYNCITMITLTLLTQLTVHHIYVFNVLADSRSAPGYIITGGCFLYERSHETGDFFFCR